MKKLKARWGIHSNTQFTLILVVFAITGTTAARCAAPIAAWLGVNDSTTTPWLYWPLQLVLILPLYQVLLLLVGSLFGQFRFFWAFEKRMLARCGLSFDGNGAVSDFGIEGTTGSDGPLVDEIDSVGGHQATANKLFAKQSID